MPTVSNIQPAPLPAHNHLLFANREVVNKSQEAQVAGPGEVLCVAREGREGCFSFTLQIIQCIIYSV